MQGKRCHNFGPIRNILCQYIFATVFSFTIAHFFGGVDVWTLFQKTHAKKILLFVLLFLFCLSLILDSTQDDFHGQASLNHYVSIVHYFFCKYKLWFTKSIFPNVVLTVWLSFLAMCHWSSAGNSFIYKIGGFFWPVKKVLNLWCCPQIEVPGDPCSKAQGSAPLRASP